MRNFLNGVGALIFALVFLAAGIFCIVLGANKISKLNSGNYTEIKSTITKVETIETADSDSENGVRVDHKITVEYTVDGTKYVSVLNENPDEFHEGMELTVLCNKDDPTDIILPGKGGAIILIVLGAVAILVSGAMVLKKIRGR